MLEAIATDTSLDVSPAGASAYQEHSAPTGRHGLRYGQALCGFPHWPRPVKDKWVAFDEVGDITCPACKIIATYLKQWSL